MNQRASRETREPTIRDVARHAGVSHTTVSRVINSEPLVRPATRKRVNAAIEALNFAPNRAARALAGAGQLRIALLHRFPNPSYLGEYLVSLHEQTARLHATLLVQKVSGRSEDRTVVQELAAQGVQAAILTPPLGDDEDLLELLRDGGFSVVTTGSLRTDAGLASVGIDDGGAAQAITEHLLVLGHRRIGFITGDTGHASTEFRLAGFRTAVERAGLSSGDVLIAEGRYTYQSGLEAAERLLGLDQPPTAIFASNDDMAAATVAVAHRFGIDVPGRLSVCGFDDTLLATAIWPQLTTVRQPIDDVVKTALELLLAESSTREAKEQEPRQRIVLPFLVVRRGSDGPPPAH